MPRYTVLRDFGSHLGNHYRGESLSLPDGPLPRGFDGFVERVPDPPAPETKDVVARSSRPPDVDSGAGSADRPEPQTQPTPASEAEAGYADKMLRAKRGRA